MLLAVAMNSTLAQVEWHVEVVIGERVILSRVEHFEKGRRRVAAEVGAEFVDFVEHHDRVSCNRPCEARQ